VLFVLQLLSGLLRRGVSFDVLETWRIFIHALGNALLLAAVADVVYVAIEPVVRRRWAPQLIAWTRLVSGRWRDPLVGRDVMIGVIGGLVHTLFALGSDLLMRRVAGKEPAPSLESMFRINGIRETLDALIVGVSSGIAQSFGCMGVLALLTILLRKRAFAVAGLFALWLTWFAFATGGNLATMPILVTLTAVLVLLVARYGLLAFAVTQTIFGWLFFLPAVPVQWAMPLLMLPFAATALLTLWAFYTSLGGQSPFSASLFEE
ncbi:MAG TPA: hypothetical protein VEU30_06505, partial [Thermoanaerobaculia bacterium]|nr:hypothetical protein [Thermoanaerobaculia bacterium]